MISELVHGSFLSAKTGALAWWKANGRPPMILMCDPPYAKVKSYVRGRVRASRETSRAISYGGLTPAVRKGIAEIAAVAEWSMIYGMPDDMGNWRTSIEKMGGAWCGVGLVLQTRGAPRMAGDAPGVRHLALAIARRRRRGARWRGRVWAEYTETRPQSAKRRPIAGTREVTCLQTMIADMRASIDRDTPPVVVDPCAGTGTTLMAARTLGLPSIGWERDEKTYLYARRVIDGLGFAVEGQSDLQLQMDQ